MAATWAFPLSSAPNTTSRVTWPPTANWASASTSSISDWPISSKEKANISYPDPCRLGCSGVNSAVVLVGFLLIDTQPLYIVKDHGRPKSPLLTTQYHMPQFQTIHMPHKKPPGR